jgi:hypothetical protein
MYDLRVEKHIVETTGQVPNWTGHPDSRAYKGLAILLTNAWGRAPRRHITGDVDKVVIPRTQVEAEGDWSLQLDDAERSVNSGQVVVVMIPHGAHLPRVLHMISYNDYFDVKTIFGSVEIPKVYAEALTHWKRGCETKDVGFVLTRSLAEYNTRGPGKMFQCVTYKGLDAGVVSSEREPDPNISWDEPLWTSWESIMPRVDARLTIETDWMWQLGSEECGYDWIQRKGIVIQRGRLPLGILKKMNNRLPFFSGDIPSGVVGPCILIDPKEGTFLRELLETRPCYRLVTRRPHQPIQKRVSGPDVELARLPIALLDDKAVRLYKAKLKQDDAVTSVPQLVGSISLDGVQVASSGSRLNPVNEAVRGVFTRGGVTLSRGEPSWRDVFRTLNLSEVQNVEKLIEKMKQKEVHVTGVLEAPIGQVLSLKERSLLQFLLKCEGGPCVLGVMGERGVGKSGFLGLVSEEKLAQVLDVDDIDGIDSDNFISSLQKALEMAFPNEDWSKEVTLEDHESDRTVCQVPADVMRVIHATVGAWIKWMVPQLQARLPSEGLVIVACHRRQDLNGLNAYTRLQQVLPMWDSMAGVFARKEGSLRRVEYVMTKYLNNAPKPVLSHQCYFHELLAVLREYDRTMQEKAQ